MDDVAWSLMNNKEFFAVRGYGKERFPRQLPRIRANYRSVAG
jgi:hypothetical protein